MDITLKLTQDQFNIILGTFVVSIDELDQTSKKYPNDPSFCELFRQARDRKQAVLDVLFEQEKQQTKPI